MSYVKKTFWVTVISVVIAFFTWLANHSGVDTEIKGDKNQVVRSVTMGDNSSLAQVQNTYNYYLDEKDVKKLEEENRPIGDAIKQYNPVLPQFSDRPKVVIIPTVTVTNWPDGSSVYGEKLPNGCVTAGFDVKFLNIGGKEAKDLKTTRWIILDNSRKITGFNEWLEVIKQKPYVKDILPPRTIYNLRYGPHIGAAGNGNLRLVLDYEYADTETDIKYTEQYGGFVNYETVKNGVGVFYLLSPLTKEDIEKVFSLAK